jgi:hypothetical protein
LLVFKNPYSMFNKRNVMSIISSTGLVKSISKVTKGAQNIQNVADCVNSYIMTHIRELLRKIRM